MVWVWLPVFKVCNRSCAVMVDFCQDRTVSRRAHVVTGCFWTVRVVVLVTALSTTFTGVTIVENLLRKNSAQGQICDRTFVLSTHIEEVNNSMLGHRSLSWPCPGCVHFTLQRCSTSRATHIIIPVTPILSIYRLQLPPPNTLLHTSSTINS